MIIKKVKSKGGSSKAGRVKSLTDYITDEKGKDRDKIAYSGGRGFIGDSFICHQAEMIALADDAPRSTNPIAHWVVSWKEDEKPSREQVERAEFSRQFQFDFLLQRFLAIPVRWCMGGYRPSPSDGQL